MAGYSSRQAPFGDARRASAGQFPLHIEGPRLAAFIPRPSTPPPRWPNGKPDSVEGLHRGARSAGRFESGGSSSSTDLTGWRVDKPRRPKEAARNRLRLQAGYASAPDEAWWLRVTITWLRQMARRQYKWLRVTRRLDLSSVYASDDFHLWLRQVVTHRRRRGYAKRISG